MWDLRVQFFALAGCCCKRIVTADLPGMLAWNKKPPASFASKIAPAPDTHSAINSAATQAAVCVAAAVLSRASHVVSLVLGHLLAFLPGSALVLRADIVNALCWLASVVFAIRAANTLSTWHTTRPASIEQQKMAPPTRKLFGLPPAPPKPEVVPKPRTLPVPGGATNLAAPLAVPLRTPGAPASDYAASASTVAALSSSARGAAFAPAPAPEAIATPEQLQQYLSSLDDRQQSPAGAGAGAGAVQDPWYVSGYGAGGDVYGFPGMAALTQDQTENPSPALPVGGEAPKYRPSWLPRAKAAVHAPDVLTQSSPDEVEEVLKSLMGVEEQSASTCLELWVENLREWLSKQVVQPLVHVVDTAHADVNQILAHFNQPVRLPPLSEVIGASSSSLGGVGGDRQPSVGDIEAMVRYVQGFCQALSQQAAQQNNALMLAKALVRYDQLLLLLRGKLPADLLPPVPPGYIWARVQALAEGTCLPAYQWAGGEAWGGRPWSPDLPTDTALVLYLFAAFLEAPAWDFPLKQNGVQPTRGMPLYLGQLPTRPPNQYSAILVHRPDKPSPRVDAILALNVAGQAPMMCFLVESRIVALTGYHALFHVIILFVLYHKQHYNSMLGNHYLHDPALSLLQVVEPPPAGSRIVRKQSVYGVWFPPSRPGALDSVVD